MDIECAPVMPMSDSSLNFMEIDMAFLLSCVVVGTVVGFVIFEHNAVIPRRPRNNHTGSSPAIRHCPAVWICRGLAAVTRVLRFYWC